MKSWNDYILLLLCPCAYTCIDIIMFLFIKIVSFEKFEPFFFIQTIQDTPKWRHLLVAWLTCLKGRIPPLIRKESAAMPAIPSPGSLSCRNEALGWWCVWCAQCVAHALDSGCELCRMILLLVVGNNSAGGWITGHVLTACSELQPQG